MRNFSFLAGNSAFICSAPAFLGYLTINNSRLTICVTQNTIRAFHFAVLWVFAVCHVQPAIRREINCKFVGALGEN
jgi:hypothetical protein